MEVTCTVNGLLSSITNDQDRKAFKKFIGDKDFCGGVQIRLYDRWSSAQQGKLWRDIGKAANQVLWTQGKMYAVLQTSIATGHLFTETEELPWTNGRSKTVTKPKTFSSWSKQDVMDGMDVILEFMEYLLQDFHQEEIVFAWSSRDNEADGTEMFQFTGRPYPPEE